MIEIPQPNDEGGIVHANGPEPDAKTFFLNVVLHIRSDADDDFLAVKENDLFDADNAGGDFFDLLQQSDAEADAAVTPLERIIGMNRDVHNGDLFWRGAEKDDDTDRIGLAAGTIEGEKGLGFVIADAHGKAGW
jgi:hypothetical protein